MNLHTKPAPSLRVSIHKRADGRWGIYDNVDQKWLVTDHTDLELAQSDADNWAYHLECEGAASDEDEYEHVNGNGTYGRHVASFSRPSGY